MTRQTASPPPVMLEEMEFYQAVLVYAKLVKSKREGWQDQIEVEWELKQGQKLRDWVAVALGETAAGEPARLRQLLNALGEQPRSTELWFDLDTLEWGYDLDGNDTTPAYAVMAPGMVVMLAGVKRKDQKGVERFKITSYRTANPKARK